MLADMLITDLSRERLHGDGVLVFGHVRNVCTPLAVAFDSVLREIPGREIE